MLYFKNRIFRAFNPYGTTNLGYLLYSGLGNLVNFYKGCLKVFRKPIALSFYAFHCVPRCILPQNTLRFVVD